MQKPITEKLELIPTQPGVYQFKDNTGTVIYVGKAKILKNRVKSYFIENVKEAVKLKALRNKIFDVEFFIVDSEREALILENNLIKEFNPKYNIRLKDDKTYPYIRITKEAFPQVFITRRIIRDGSKYIGPYTDVMDVKQALRTIHKFFQVRTCRFEMTEDSIKAAKHKICLDYHIMRCGGPCEAFQNREDYLKIITHVERFLLGRSSELMSELNLEMKRFAEKTHFEKAAKIRDTINAIKVFYDKKQKVEQSEELSQDFFGIILQDLDVSICILKVREGKVLGKQEFQFHNELQEPEETVVEQFMLNHYADTQITPDEIFIADNSSYEPSILQSILRDLTKTNLRLYNPKIGDKIKLLRLAQINAKHKLDEISLARLKKDYVPEGLKSLQRDLRLKGLPMRIDCFDNSNIQGTDAVSSMVVFLNGKPAKEEYRKYKIKSLEDGVVNDFASMYEVITRRYKRVRDENLSWPDLIMVDGGKGQLSSAVKALEDLGVYPKPIIGLAKRLEEVFIPGHSDAQMIPKTSSAIKILQQLRDEAHRFAITFHRDRRSKRAISGFLDEIDGIGKKRKKDLLKFFGSLDGIIEKGLAELKASKILPENVAEHLWAKINDEY